MSPSASSFATCRCENCRHCGGCYRSEARPAQRSEDARAAPSSSRRPAPPSQKDPAGRDQPQAGPADPARSSDEAPLRFLMMTAHKIVPPISPLMADLIFAQCSFTTQAEQYVRGNINQARDGSRYIEGTLNLGLTNVRVRLTQA